MDGVVHEGKGDAGSRSAVARGNKGNHCFGGRIFNFLLDQAAKITCTVGDGISFPYKPGRDLFLPGEIDTSGRKSLFQFLQHNDCNSGKILLRELIEADDFIYTVHKLRT